VLLLSILLGWAGVQAALWLVELFGGASDGYGGAALLEAFRIDTDLSAKGYYWKWFSYAVVHSDWVHFFVNALVIYAAGREVEPIIGRRHFLAMSMVAWVGGGLVSWAVLSGNPDHEIGVVGFSAPAAAVLAAYSTIMPELEQRLNIFFIIPLRFRAKFYALAVVALAAVCLFTNTPTSVGPAGILLGCVLGWAWAKQLGFGNPLWVQRMVFERRQRESRLSRMNATEFVALEVDPVLDKITRSGIESLTRAERKLLEQGSGKLSEKAKPQSRKA
jgi:membrane associated rhomboid family serine protease